MGRDRPYPDADIDQDQERVLLARIRDGDEQAFTTLVTLYLDAVTVFAFYIVRSHDAAEDIAQSVFVSLWEGRHNLDAVRSAKSYLFRSVRNRALDEQKANAIRARYSAAMQAEAETGTRSAAAPSIEEALLTASTVQAAMLQLSERHQVALRLRIHDEMTHAEIGEILEISPETAQRLVSRAVANLRKILRLSD